jgi:hypothetical protein
MPSFVLKVKSWTRNISLSAEKEAAGQLDRQKLQLSR